jgi:hypothetical protein
MAVALAVALDAIGQNLGYIRRGCLRQDGRKGQQGKSQRGEEQLHQGLQAGAK